MWWQLLAYAIITAAEIMVSVPALEFAYTQAPKKMKSLIMAAYLAGSISFGNVIAGLVIRALQARRRRPARDRRQQPELLLGLHRPDRRRGTGLRARVTPDPREGFPRGGRAFPAGRA